VTRARSNPGKATHPQHQVNIRGCNYLDLPRQVHEAVKENNFAAFASQRVAFCISSSVDVERMVQAGRDAGFTVQAAQFPFNDSVPCHGNLIGGDSLWLAAERHKLSGHAGIMNDSEPGDAG
jgi:hypothetical protein